jgi:hypothetical protein
VKDNALHKLDSVVLELDSYRKNGENYRSRIALKVDFLKSISVLIASRIVSSLLLVIITLIYRPFWIRISSVTILSY